MGDLDEAALKLAHAGSGHYRPASQNGQPVAGCDSFRVKFQLRIDPGFPTLSRRANQLKAEIRPNLERIETRVENIKRLPDLATLQPGNSQQMAVLRHFVDDASPLWKQYAGELSKLIARMDDLGRADDVTEAERTAFSKDWQPKRVVLTRLREAALDAQELTATIDDLLSYWGKPGPLQLANIDLIIKRGQRIYGAKLEPVLEDLKHPQSDPQPEGAPRTSAGSAIELLAIEDNQYSEASMPDVSPPHVVSSGNSTKSSCVYPESAINASQEGTTILRLRIDANGQLSGTSVLRSSGYEDLDAAAVNCANKRQYQPAKRGTVPTASVVRYTLTWKIDWGSTGEKSCGELKAESDKRIGSAPTVPAAIVCSCFEESGKQSVVELKRSSGSSRLDDAAIGLTKKGASRPRPPGHGGCYTFRYKFEIRDEPGAKPAVQ